MRAKLKTQSGPRGPNLQKERMIMDYNNTGFNPQPNPFNQYNPNPQPGYGQPAAPVQTGSPKALLFGILSIVLPCVGAIVESVFSSTLTNGYFVTYSKVTGLIAVAVICGILFSIGGIVLSAVATHMAGKHPSGKAMGGKVTGIIGRVESIICLVCGVIILVAGLMLLTQF